MALLAYGAVYTFSLVRNCVCFRNCYEHLNICPDVSKIEERPKNPGTLEDIVIIWHGALFLPYFLRFILFGGVSFYSAAFHSILFYSDKLFARV